MNIAARLLLFAGPALLTGVSAHAERVYTDHTIPVEGAPAVTVADSQRVYRSGGASEDSRTVISDTRDLRDDGFDTEPLSDARLEQLLAPVALYPDTVLAQVLIASTYPLEVVEAARWSREHPDLDGEAAVEAVADRDWDPSVQALVAFPDVLARLDENLEWMQDLGEAFLYQEADVIAAVQRLRGHASDAGTLDTMEHVEVIREQETIIIEPVRERIVYVPYYDTRVVYGSWRHPHYAPVYWYPPRHYAPLGSYFYWGHGITVSSGFYFSTFHWPARHVYVVPRHRPHVHLHYHSAPRKHVHLHGSRWRHDPVHRRGVRYRHRGVQQYWSGRQHERGGYTRRAPRHDAPRVASAPRGSQQSDTRRHRRGDDRATRGSNTRGGDSARLRSDFSGNRDWRGRADASPRGGERQRQQGERRRSAEDVGARIAGAQGNRGERWRSPDTQRRDRPDQRTGQVRQELRGGNARSDTASRGDRGRPTASTGVGARSPAAGNTNRRSADRRTTQRPATDRPRETRFAGQSRPDTRSRADTQARTDNRSRADNHTRSNRSSPPPRQRAASPRNEGPAPRSNRGSNQRRDSSASGRNPSSATRGATRGNSGGSSRMRGTARGDGVQRGNRQGQRGHREGQRGSHRGGGRLGGGRQRDR